MAYSEELADRIRDVIGARSGVREQRMMGGIVWMLTGNMAVGAFGDDLLVRLGEEGAVRAIAEEGVAQMEMKGRPMAAFVNVEAARIADDAELARWVDAGADFAASLPPK